MGADLLQELSLPPGASADDVERRFIEYVKDRIQTVAESYDENLAAEEEKSLRALHHSYFEFCLRQAAQQVAGQADEKTRLKDHPDAQKFKAEARSVVDSMQKIVLEFAACYLHINRLTTLVRDEVRKEEGRLGFSNVRWTADAGIMIGRYRKQKNDILADYERFQAARPVLNEASSLLADIRARVSALFGKEKEEEIMRRIVSSLRIADFKRAQSVLKDVTGSKRKFSLDAKAAEESAKILEESMKKLIALVQENAAMLAGADKKLILSAAEADTIWASHVQDLRKIKGFLHKYHLSYMQYKLDGLQHLKDKLLVISSYESLMTLYRRLIQGIAGPLSDIKEVRHFENDVIGKIKWLRDGSFAEIGTIRKRASETVEEFHEGYREFAEMEQLQIDEVATLGRQAASG